MSQIRHGKRDVTLELIAKLYSEFKGNPNYLFSGKGAKFLKENIPAYLEEPSTSYFFSKKERTAIKTLEELVDSKDEIIALLKNEVNRLNEELGKIKED